jgi:hypothetical protein
MIVRFACRLIFLPFVPDQPGTMSDLCAVAVQCHETGRILGVDATCDGLTDRIQDLELSFHHHRFFPLVATVR